MCICSGRFEINQLLLADDIALVADTLKLCRLVSEFDRVGKNKVNWLKDEHFCTFTNKSGN